MKVGIPYVITKASNCNTLEVGDHVELNTLGNLECREAGGTILDAEDFEAFTQGVEYVLDKDFIQEELHFLENRLQTLKNILQEDEQNA